MSKVLQKKNHWITKVKECAVDREPSGELDVELRGGAQDGQFAYIGHVREDAALQEGRLSEGELLLEVEGLSVSGLPLYDIHTVINCCRGPVRFRTVRQGKISHTRAVCFLVSTCWWDAAAPSSSCLHSWSQQRHEAVLTLTCSFGQHYCFSSLFGSELQAHRSH